ncbi:unnamed protein product [Cylicocyclus nassatus]|uniref:Lysozyme n=1 Tax=Cylicocyclus nassatus TaxID=53992 RepID=A0AA36GTD5_CYLNA|nr:unnamed protein product [Cylicocyclus nassatus]
MQKYLNLLSLVSLCLVKAAPTSNQTFYNYAYAVDLSGPVPYNTFTCIKSNGYSAVFTRAYDPSGMGMFDVNAVNNIRSAYQAGLGTEVFMAPLLRSMKRGSEQFRELYDGLRYGNVQLKMVWIQVAFPVNWGPNTQENINFLNDIIMAANSYGIAIGIYTNAYDWDQITKGANVGNAMLWYWNVYRAGPSGETPANFDDFRPFSSFYRPTVKQFAQKENVCGIVVNRDAYTMNTVKYGSKLLQKSDGKIVVGLLGSTMGFVQSV